MSVFVTSIPDPFKPLENKKVIYEYEDDKFLDYYLSHIDLEVENIILVVTLNGQQIPLDMLYITPVQDGDIVATCAELMVAGSIAAWAASAAVGGSAAFGTAITYALVYAVTYVAVSFATSYGMSMLANALGGEPDLATGDSYSDPIYGWNNLSQTKGEGNSIPILFGTTRISGQTIQTYVETSNDEEVLNTLLGICDHELDSITDVHINDQPYTFFKDTTVFTRLGTINDTIIDGFDEVVTQIDIGSKLSPSSPITQQTGGTSVEKLIVVVTAPNGLYYTNSNGGLSTRTAEFTVEYRVVGGAWSTYTSITLSGQTTETQREKIVIDDLTPDQYEVRVNRTNAEETSFKGNSDIYFTSLQEIVKDSFIYPGLAKYAVKVLATNQLSGAAPTFSCIAARETVQVFDRDLVTPIWVSKRATNPAWMVYSLLTEFAGLNESQLIWEDFSTWADYCDEDIDGDYRFAPNVILYSGNYWSEANKIAKLGRAVLVRRGTRYGVFCDKYEGVDPSVSAMFSTGNIIDGSFSISYLPKADRSNAVDVEYTDINRSYTRQALSVFSDDYLVTGEAYSKRTSVIINAAISQKEATREGVYRINSNKYLNRTVTFDAYIDSFACTVGDLFYFQNRAIDYLDNIGGRVIEAGNDYNSTGVPYVIIDHDIDIGSSGDTYAINVRFPDGSFVEKTIIGFYYSSYSDPWVGYEENWESRYTENWTEGGTSVSILLVDTNWATLPEVEYLYTLGIIETYKKIYRLTSADRKDDFVRTLVGIEYIEDIYSHNDSYVIEEPTWTTRKPTAINVIINEFLSYSTDGGYQSNLNIAWDRAYTQSSSNWTVWLENITAGTPPKNLGNVFTDSYVVRQGLVIGDEYKVYISALDEGAVDTGDNTQTHVVLGKLAPPEDIINFDASWDSITRQVNFSWSAVSDIDLANYEIRFGATWAGGVVVVEPTTNYAAEYIEEVWDADRTYTIKAKDTSGIYSENEASDTVSVNTSETPLLQPGNLQLTSASEITSDGTNVVSLTATWNDASEASDFFSSYDIELEDITTGGKSRFATSDRDYRWEVIPNKEYGVTLRAVDTAGNFTAFIAQVTITTAKDDTPPAAPTSLVASGTWTQILLTWDHGAENDLNHFLIFRNTTNNSGSALQIGSSVKTFSDAFGSYADTPPTGDTYYYWVRGVDSSDNVSDFSSSANAFAPGGTFEATITETMIEDDSISTPKLQANSVIASNIFAGAVGTDALAANSVVASKIQVTQLDAISVDAGTLTSGRLQNTGNTSYFDLDANTFALGSKLTWNGVDLTIPSGSVTVGIGDCNSTLIDNGYIATNLVRAASIEADAITADKIDAGAVTANSVGTNEIIANAANIKNAVITGAKIGNLQVDTLQIADDAVTVPSGATGTSSAQTATITFDGTTPVMIFGFGEVTSTSAETSYTISLYEGTTLLYSTRITVGFEAGGTYQSATPIILRTPASGSRYYRVVLSGGAVKCSIIVLNVKK